MTTRAAPNVKPFAERMKRMEGASVTPVSAIRGRTVYRVQAVGSKDGHDIPVILEGRTPIVGDCDCDAYHYLRDPEGCVHIHYLRNWLKENNTLTTTEMTTRTNGIAANNDLPSYEVMEMVLGTGDIGRLSAQQRVEYYIKLCESIGLNPMSRPFEFITFQGKVVPYVKKDATDQLRKIHEVSILRLDREFADGMYTVTAHAQVPSGRQDESTGVVNIGSLQGEARANAYMRAESKAKRRVTLSICGLGFLEESEVGSIPGQQSVRFDHRTGDMDIPAAQPIPQGNAVTAEWEATKSRIIAKKDGLPKETWVAYHGANVKKWANRSLSELQQIEKDVDDMLRITLLPAEGPETAEAGISPEELAQAAAEAAEGDEDPFGADAEA